MGYTDKSAHVSCSFSISRCTWKWIKKLFFSPLEPLKSEQFYSPHLLWFIIISLKFQTCLGQGLLWGGDDDDDDDDQPPSSNQRTQPHKHWPSEGKLVWCHVMFQEKQGNQDKIQTHKMQCAVVLTHALVITNAHF
jgi:hypothetical protein